MLAKSAAPLIRDSGASDVHTRLTVQSAVGTVAKENLTKKIPFYFELVVLADVVRSAPLHKHSPEFQKYLKPKQTESSTNEQQFIIIYKRI